MGTLEYKAPEILNHKEYNHTIDNWCLGVLAYEMLVGKSPFDDTSDNKIRQRICSVDFSFPSFVSSEAQSFIGSLLVLDPDKRLPLDEVPNHPWIIKYQHFHL